MISDTLILASNSSNVQQIAVIIQALMIILGYFIHKTRK